MLLYDKVNPSVLIGAILVRISPYGRHRLCIFLFPKASKFKISMARVPYNKLLTKLASSNRTGEYWPSIVFVRTSGEYFPVLPSRSVSKKLIFIKCRMYCKMYVTMYSRRSITINNDFLDVPKV